MVNGMKIRARKAISLHITYTTKRQASSPVTPNGISIPQSNRAKYLGVYLEQKLIWKHHIFTTRKALGSKLGSNSRVHDQNCLYQTNFPKANMNL